MYILYIIVFCHLSLFDVLLFIDFSQAQFALLLVKGACPGVVIRLLLRLDTPLHIIPSLATEIMMIIIIML